ncbi:hypothetical protein GCM10009678_75380 [Actinomadura kijaniata]|uniref:RNA polymerase sigma factor (Sigma-70 family) n=1 Tax=Actinomadura namibiensis TaxID=182080 RepID=A0A7W3LYN4_ACTNM|nr:sigma-70 family RNA polymerase sigma factor [Actinomadura namibiensis]MBA8956625.1 RNA polymerase sigma factor (sigma-70 family) [Actinomadura namibiensis]
MTPAGGTRPRPEPPPFDDLYRLYRDKVLWFLRRLPAGSGVSPEDVAQQAWTRVWEHRREIRSSPWGYVRKVAHNTALEALSAEPDGEDAPPRSPGDEEEHRRELAARVMDAVERLPRRQRAVILLWISEEPGPTCGQIGRRLGTGRKTVAEHRRRAPHSLRRALGDAPAPLGGVEEGERP